MLTFVALGLDTDSVFQWLRQADGAPALGPIVLGVVVLSVPLTLAFEAFLARWLGRVPAGVVSRWSRTYLRVWLTMGLVESAGRWLSGTLFWPLWLRWAGMNVGPGCEISTIMNVVPGLVTIGPETFFADGIYLGGPRIERGVVTLLPTTLGANTFLGNHVVIPAGQDLPDDILLGVCTVADDRVIRPGTSWFGHPPFALPRREVVARDRRLTHEPSPIRYANRVVWELLRFVLPVGPILVALWWYRTVNDVARQVSPGVLVGLMVPLISFGAAAILCGIVLGLKWLLLGKVRPGQHPLWSCWCSRWDFLYVAWGQYARPVLSALEGTLLLAWYLRAMGMRIGRRVVLSQGFAQVVDPDMIAIDDGATVDAMFQAHTFEDRVLKIGPVTIRRGATLGANTVPLYGVVVGERAHVAPHSVIMKQEHLLAHHAYEGSPTNPVGSTRRERFAAEHATLLSSVVVWIWVMFVS